MYELISFVLGCVAYTLWVAFTKAAARLIDNRRSKDIPATEDVQPVAEMVGELTRAQFEAALKKVSRPLPDDEDAYWTKKAKAGRDSGMVSDEYNALLQDGSNHEESRLNQPSRSLLDALSTTKARHRGQAERKRT